MSLPALSLPAELLLRHQNQDGGWGFVPGKASWLEPTYYAMLALEADPAHSKVLDKAWSRIRSWQLPDGGCRPTDSVDQPTWVTALWIQLHCRRMVFDNRFFDALFWLTQARGEDGKLWRRLLSRIQNVPDRYGWSWLPGAHSWTEPTAHALVALQLSLARAKPLPSLLANTMKERISLGQQMLLDRRCADGGWNYGSRSALQVQLPSYPETTALALLGLQQTSAAQRKSACSRAEQFYHQAKSPLALALLQLALRVHGVSVPTSSNPIPESTSLTLASIQMLGAENGNFNSLVTRS